MGFKTSTDILVLMVEVERSMVEFLCVMVSFWVLFGFMYSFFRFMGFVFMFRDMHNVCICDKGFWGRCLCIQSWDLAP